MSAGAIAGTFTSIGQPSAEMLEGLGNFGLTTIGCNANNTVKTQKSVNGGLTWSDVTTYNSEQSGTTISPAANERYRLVAVALQANKQVGYKMSRET